jgi:hypothetical protein
MCQFSSKFVACPRRSYVLKASNSPSPPLSSSNFFRRRWTSENVHKIRKRIHKASFTGSAKGVRKWPEVAERKDKNEM